MLHAGIVCLDFQISVVNGNRKWYDNYQQFLSRKEMENKYDDDNCVISVDRWLFVIGKRC